MDTRTLSGNNLTELIEYIGPRRYVVTGLPDNEPLYIFALGCHGEEGIRQKAVAELMNAKAKERTPHLILFLGDNVYGGAPTSTADKKFDERFHSVYNLEYLKNVPTVEILGNHDSDLDNHTFYANKAIEVTLSFTFGMTLGFLPTPHATGRAAEKYEVAHTYLYKNLHHFTQPNLSTKNMLGWTMPYYYCSYILNKHTELICLNSNDYVSSFISIYTTKNHPENFENQALWFEKIFFDARKQNRTTIVAMHNPLVTSSKRAFESKYDAHLYLTTSQIQQMNYLQAAYAEGILSPEIILEVFSGSNENLNSAITIMPTNGSYASMIKLCFLVRGILKQDNLDARNDVKPDIILAAHDHALVFNTSRDICQVISGAGGSTSLMEKKTDINNHSEGCFVSEPGFTALTVNRHENKAAIHIDFHTTEGKHLQFNHEDRTALLDNPQIELNENNFYNVAPSCISDAARAAAPASLAPLSLFSTASRHSSPSSLRKSSQEARDGLTHSNSF